VRGSDYQQHSIDSIGWVADLVAHLGERLVKSLGDSLLMVTQYSHHSIGSIVRRNLFSDGSVLRRVLQLLLESPRGIVRSENFS
jgi:hypothetical protein